MSIFKVSGDLLESTDDYIGHQCNCTSTNAKGLAKIIFDKYPYANDYHKKRCVGKFRIHGDGEDERYVINFYGQLTPGRSISEIPKRIEWLKKSLTSFGQTIGDNKVSLGLPYLIGCGMAGGNWDEYYEMLKEIAETYPNIKITLYQK